MDYINNINIMGFGGIVFDFIISKIFKTFIIIGSGDSDSLGFYKEIRMEIVKNVKLVGGHMVNILMDGC